MIEYFCFSSLTFALSIYSCKIGSSVATQKPGWLDLPKCTTLVISVWRPSLKTGKRPRLDQTKTGKDQDQTRPRPEKTAKRPVLIDRPLWLRPVWTGRPIPPINTFNLSLYPSKLVEIWQCYGQNYKISDKKSRCDGNKSYLTQFLIVFNVTGLILKVICQSTIPIDK